MECYRFTSPIRKSPPLGPSKDHRHRPTAGSWDAAFYYKRGTPVSASALAWGLGSRVCRSLGFGVEDGLLEKFEERGSGWFGYDLSLSLSTPLPLPPSPPLSLSLCRWGVVGTYIDALAQPSGEALLFFGHLVRRFSDASDLPQSRFPLGCSCRLSIANPDSIISVY